MNGDEKFMQILALVKERTHFIPLATFKLEDQSKEYFFHTPYILKIEAE